MMDRWRSGRASRLRRRRRRRRRVRGRHRCRRVFADGDPVPRSTDPQESRPGVGRTLDPDGRTAARRVGEASGVEPRSIAAVDVAAEGWNLGHRSTAHRLGEVPEGPEGSRRGEPPSRAERVRVGVEQHGELGRNVFRDPGCVRGRVRGHDRRAAATSRPPRISWVRGKVIALMIGGGLPHGLTSRGWRRRRTRPSRAVAPRPHEALERRQDLRRRRDRRVRTRVVGCHDRARGAARKASCCNRPAHRLRAGTGSRTTPRQCAYSDGTSSDSARRRWDGSAWIDA